MPTSAWEFSYPLRAQSVDVHFKPWGRAASAELRDRLATAPGPHEMLTLLEEELMRRLCQTASLGLVRHTSTVIAATSGAVAIGDLSPLDRSTGVTSPVAQATSTRPTSAL